MAIKGFNRPLFEQTLRRTLSPTTPIRAPSQLRGREKLLEDIRRSLVQPGRHIFIHGDRGVGKTSLAQTVALEQQSSERMLVFLGCDNASTFYRTLRRQVDPSGPAGGQGRFWLGPLPAITAPIRGTEFGIALVPLGEARHEAAAPGISASGSGCRSAPSPLAHRKRASLSITAGPHQYLRIEVNHVQKTHCL